MIGFLLDTNVPSELTRSNPSPEVVRWLASVEDDQLYFSVMSMAEVVRGIQRLPESRRRHQLQTWLDFTLRPQMNGRILPITEPIAERLGVLSAFREKQGRPIDLPDGFIAATAFEYDLTLVTRNTRHFAGLDLPLLDPWRHWVF